MCSGGDAAHRYHYCSNLLSFVVDLSLDCAGETLYSLDSVILASIRHDIVGLFRTSSDTVDAECLPRVVCAVV